MPTGADDADEEVDDGWAPDTDAVDDEAADPEASAEDFGLAPDDLGPDPAPPDPPAVDEDQSGPHGGDETEVSPELARTFWKLVALSNVATVALAVGVLFIAVRGRWSLGGQLVAFGVLTVAYMVREYRQFRRDRSEPDDDSA